MVVAYSPLKTKAKVKSELPKNDLKDANLTRGKVLNIFDRASFSGLAQNESADRIANGQNAAI